MVAIGYPPSSAAWHQYNSTLGEKKKRRERYHRQRDNTLSPFRSISETRSTDLVRQRQYPNAYHLRPPQYTPSFVHGTDATPAHVETRHSTGPLRQISSGFWTVGGRSSVQVGQLPGILSASGELLVSGATAPLHTANFLNEPTFEDKIIDHERRLALALEIDQANRILPQPSMEGGKIDKFIPNHNQYVWRDSMWTRASPAHDSSIKSENETRREKAVPAVPFRVLDAPNLKDDYYCSILAYSHTCHTLAVALTQKVYLWTEKYSVRYPPLSPARATNFVTSLAFSSEEGGKAILAVARNNGTVTLWSLLEPRPRFEAPHHSPASCVAFRPTITWRRSATYDATVICEDLLVGDDVGKVYYYSLEWSDHWQGSMTLLAKIDAHSQNVCGMAWSPDGNAFVSGGNDNRALLFDADLVLQAQDTEGPLANVSANPPQNSGMMPPATPIASPDRGIPPGNVEWMEQQAQTNRMQDTLWATPPPTPLRGRTPTRAPHLEGHEPGSDRNRPLLRNELGNPAIPGLSDVHIYSFYHAAAVKAIAFAPWQPTLLATGGGSNDRQIHFFHAGSGATLALINVFSQVTSLV
ncbi:uncharacterized protein A1O9_08971 [Exophiala aquamarina CBS 119918]|uniref:Uncharacterized protein n=1 Tax=Exophiala aquamarina CBS 119918 TaxID=1182545 RepID=A0A072P6J1_9EURO|nr:uncharacterized protein A1O9_08971 [Exophiala aquamarina CBS 119918]KEF55317.1 hypothetical protein A1O9_08971 [Exophiala aquamarina CBS 119918]